MELQWLGGPFLAVGLTGLSVAAIAFLRPEPLLRVRRGPVLLTLASAGFLLLTAAHRFQLSTPRLSPTSVGRILGGALLVLSAALAARANRVRLRADALRAGAPMAIEDAIAQVRESGRRSAPVLLEGRLGASDPVTSPGGVVCAFYDAAIREIRSDGDPGSLLRSEKGSVQVVWVAGERAQVAVPLGAAAIHGQLEIHRCQWTEGLTCTDDPPDPVEALSFERVGRLGERCVVFGRVAAGPATGTYLVEGVTGGPPLLWVGGDRGLPLRRLAHQAALRFAGAAAASVLAAFLLASSG